MLIDGEVGASSKKAIADSYCFLIIHNDLGGLASTLQNPGI